MRLDAAAFRLIKQAPKKKEVTREIAVSPKRRKDVVLLLILESLSEQEWISIPEIVTSKGVSQGGARIALASLKDDGKVKTKRDVADTGRKRTYYNLIEADT